MTTFSKPPTQIKDQIRLLESRGIVVRDYNSAMKFLLHCNYYRFSGYALHFENFDNKGNRAHSFRPGTSFENIVEL